MKVFSKNGSPDRKMKSAKKSQKKTKKKQKKAQQCNYIFYTIIPLMSYKNQEMIDRKGIWMIFEQVSCLTIKLVYIFCDSLEKPDRLTTQGRREMTI